MQPLSEMARPLPTLILLCAATSAWNCTAVAPNACQAAAEMAAQCHGLPVNPPIECSEDDERAAQQFLDEGCEGAREPMAKGVADSLHTEVATLYIGDSSRADLCTATIIGSRTVLTAAHCLIPVALSSHSPTVRVVLWWPSASQRTIRRWTLHERFRGESLHDIALLHLEEPLSPEQHRFATLDRAPAAYFEQMTIVGYGESLQEGGPSLERRAKTGRVTGRDDDALSMYSLLGLGGEFSHGDSGGPWYRSRGGSERLAAVSSWKDVSLLASSSRATRIDKYIDWILERANDSTIQVAER